MRPDFLTIKRNRKILRHSAKGSTWEEHKYIKRIDGTYYYPDSYEGGRHLPDGESSSDEEKKEKIDLTSDDVKKLAQEVIRGNFGNGQDRKDLLGENYQEIQNRVNQLLRSLVVSKQKIEEIPEEVVDSGKKAVEKVVTSTKKKGIDLEKVYSVYRKK